MARKYFWQLSLSTLLMTQTLTAQKVIKLENPSFEDAPQAGRAPQGWIDCGFSDETPPDVQPTKFQVGQTAQHGKTYLGLVVRDNDTWESVTQLLKTPLVQGQPYQFSLSLCKSDLYVSKSRTTGKDVNYATPVVVLIWGGNEPCAKTEKLAETQLIENEDWQTHPFRLQPRANYTYIIIEAVHKRPTLFPYNGNVLIDNASDLVPILSSSTLPLPPPPPPSPPPFVVGKISKIEDLHFHAGSDTILAASFPTLKKLTEQLKQHPNAVIEIGGHTNGLPKPEYCDSLSLGRANSVRYYLIEKGIKSARLKTKGYGKRQPKAKDDTKEGREKNQRVEIKVLSMNG
jgi:outer membrane protein OmpA-like peptidoglycan-associated protein